MTTSIRAARPRFEALGEAAANILCEINTTPLIDIMLVLLITLIIALPLMTHGVTITLPQGPPITQTSLPEVIDLGIDFDGTVLWNGTAVPSMRQLDLQLRAESSKNPQPQIRLRPDPHAKYDTVAKVLALAQQNQLKKIGFVDSVRYQD